MKKIIVLVLLLLPVMASAQRSYLGISAGITLPSSPSDFKTYWTTSFNLGLDYEKPVSEMFGVGGELNYASFALDKSAVFGNSNANVSGGSFNAVQLLAVGKICDYNSANSVSPYGRVGIGLSLTSFDDVRSGSNGNVILRGSSENGLGVMLGAGIQFNMMNGNKVILEGSYRVNNRPGDSFNAILLDVGYRFGI